jgi:hypothetical protein
MWLFYIGMLIFLIWPLLAALAFWLTWKNFHKKGMKRLSLWLLVVQVLWVGVVAVNGILSK